VSRAGQLHRRRRPSLSISLHDHIIARTNTSAQRLAVDFAWPGPLALSVDAQVSGTRLSRFGAMRTET
jgi:hypothetical protein